MTTDSKQLKSDGQPYYPHKYKFGKQKELVTPDEAKIAFKQQEQLGMFLEHLAFAAALYNFPVRKSELYERRLDPHGERCKGDVELTDDELIIDFGIDHGAEIGQRKKHGDDTGPVGIPRTFVGIEDYFVPHLHMRLSSKPPHERSLKRIRYLVDTGKTKKRNFWGGPIGNRVLLMQKEVPALEWRDEQIRAIWLFPHIGAETAIKIVKRIFGNKYYPHYFRSRKLSAVAANPETATIPALKSISGIKSTEVLNDYVFGGSDQQKKAMRVE